MTTPAKPLADLGAGLSSKAPPGGAAVGPVGQAERAFTAASTFISGILAINATQFLGAPLKVIDPKFYQAYMAFTKQSFGVLITTMTAWWSPTVVRVSGDESIPKQLARSADGTLQCRFPDRIVLMANHQLYTDWLYLWWVAYTNNMHGAIYIVLKEALRNVPFVGWGAQMYNFIFLARDWEKDQARFRDALQALDNDDPMWLVIFPEGTNLAKETRAASKRWADKQGLQDMKHVLLPRSKGLQFSLQNLRRSTEWLYDVTIGYEGIPEGQYGQDIFTLRSSMFEGRPPKSVNMHFRRFRISSIPIDNDDAFALWLRNRWREKDYMLEHFARHNKFPSDSLWLTKPNPKPCPARVIETDIRPNRMEEFLAIFAPLTAVGAVLGMAGGGADPKALAEMLQDAAKGKGALTGTRDDNSAQPSKLEKRPASKATAPAKDANKTPAPAQRDMLQEYLAALRPMLDGMPGMSGGPAVGKPTGAAAGKPTGAPSAPAKAKPPTQPARKPPPASSRAPPKAASVISAPVAQKASRPPAPRAASEAPRPAGTGRVGRQKYTIPPARPVTTGAWKGAPKVAKGTSQAGAGAKPVNIDPAVLSQMKGKTPKPVDIDPEMLARMKGKSGEKKPVSVDPSVLAKMKKGM
ncbi:acyltransferase-domain-containing protein [Trichodelitschia bisporula]|uniref:Acyltransferase-domain-containing protein n=1 Tax=Trichodelitschia bisporula TaxID=703511 RepID=A0A6G1HN06_9PEZI|nr:acyltransferase-domain-containing protein [Trichodelitschia bisporula]